MKTFTNHTAGLRGINTENGMVWLEPGESAEVDPKKIKGNLPDLGKAAKSAPAVDAGELDALNAKVEELTKQVEELTKGKEDAEKANAELTKQVEELTKPTK